MINKYEISIIIVSITLIIPNLVYGYMDPGTWSYFISIIIAFSAGSLFYIKTFWGKIKEAFIKFFRKK